MAIEYLPYQESKNPNMLPFNFTAMSPQHLTRRKLDALSPGDNGALLPVAPPASDTGFSYDALLQSMLGGSSNYDFLLNPGQGGGIGGGSFMPGNVGGPVAPSSRYNAPSGVGDQYFQDYLKTIGAPSSVDQVQKSLETDLLNQTLQGIDEQTAQDIGSSKMDYLDRGLGGPGQISDIEANALAQIRSGGAKTKAGARTQLGMAEIGRQKAREEALRGAYGQRYAAGTAQDQAEKDLRYKLLGLDVGAEQGEAERGLKRQLTGAELGLSGQKTFAELSSNERINTINNLFKKLLQKEELTSAEKLFYDELTFKTNSLDKQLASDQYQTFMKTRTGGNSFDAIGNVMGIAKGGLDLVRSGMDIFG